jgi:hypothetical protein
MAAPYADPLYAALSWVFAGEGRVAGNPGLLIRYQCVADDHVRARETGVARDTFTIVKGNWGWCPLDTRAVGHEWQLMDESPLDIGGGWTVSDGKLARHAVAVDVTR